MRPARRLDDRARLAACDIERIVARVGVDLHDAGVFRELPLWMLALAGRRVIEHGRRRGLAAERPVVAHVSPDAARAALALGQHRHRRVVDVDAPQASQAVGGVHVRTNRIAQRHQRRRAGADPVGQRRHIEIDALARIDVALPVERQVRAVLAEQHVGQQLWPARVRARSDATAPAAA